MKILVAFSGFRGTSKTDKGEYLNLMLVIDDIAESSLLVRQ